ncbi:hypothetical protein BDF22DRAFT_663925 [Syncephalis plumigaleata]|nr:hypothetical protein BDF22DRAFT_663925 [Syncephalis plumigaleata]
MRPLTGQLVKNFAIFSFIFILVTNHVTPKITKNGTSVSCACPIMPLSKRECTRVHLCLLNGKVIVFVRINAHSGAYSKLVI